MKSGINLSLIIPCYNEEKNIPLIASRVASVHISGMELVLVDNGSTDGTQKVLAEILPKYSFIRTVRVEKNRGYGYGIVQGLRNARGTFIGWTHADMQTDPADIVRAFELIQKQRDPEQCFLKGRRQGRPFSDIFFTSAMAFVASMALQTVLVDIAAQPKLFHRKFFESLKTFPDDFSLDLFFYAQAKKMGLKILTIPVVVQKRIHGVSHWNTSIKARWKLIKRTFLYILALRKIMRE